jgi:hypothetical protein
MVLFAQAETFGRPVRELLTGQPGPLTNMEFFLWARYRLAQARLRQQERGRS